MPKHHYLRNTDDIINQDEIEQVKINMQQDRTINTMKVTTKSLE